MHVKRTKEQWLESAKLEEGHEVGAGGMRTPSFQHQIRNLVQLAMSLQTTREELVEMIDEAYASAEALNPKPKEPT